MTLPEAEVDSKHTCMLCLEFKETWTDACICVREKKKNSSGLSCDTTEEEELVDDVCGQLTMNEPLFSLECDPKRRVASREKSEKSRLPVTPETRICYQV